MLKKVRLTPNTKEWYEFRKEGVGCSDIPILTGESSYSNPYKLFYQKIGMHPMDQRETELIFWGHEHEPILLDRWQYYEAGKKDSYIENTRNDRIIRRYEKNDGYVIVNEDYPFLFFTPDGIIPAGEMRLDGFKVERDSPLQAKNINHLVWQMYGGIMPHYIEQVHGEMVVMGSEYGEFVYLVGGYDFYVEQCPFSRNIADSIIQICKDFWYNRVVPAKPLAKRWLAATSDKEKSAIMHDIYQLEPPPDDTEHTRQFLAERFVNMDKKVQASEQMQGLMHIYEKLSNIESSVKKKKRLISNTLLMYHEHHGVHRLLGENCMSSMNKKHTIKGNADDKLASQIVRSEILKLI